MAFKRLDVGLRLYLCINIVYLDGWCHDKFVIIFHFMTKLFVGLSICTRQWSRALGCTSSIFNLGALGRNDIFPIALAFLSFS